MEARIVKLSDSTIRKIAAGEVITRPLNVVKELLENSIDAGATNIIVTIEQGGLKLIDIKDNGHGIAKSNAKLLCHRYATSKLTTSDDLTRISTFGFRGEALASISEMAEVEVRSFNMTTDNKGWQSSYKYGEVVPEARIRDKFMQSPGTHIRVKELFSTSMPRKNALAGSFSDEKKNIVDLVMRFAIHHRETLTLTLRDSISGSLSELVMSLAPTDIKPSIGSFFGIEMERNLLDFKLVHEDPFFAKIYVAFAHKKSPSNINKSSLILFVNNRLVECDELRKEIGALVLEFLGTKQVISMFYISIDVPPQDVDVNTHPSKETVTLHHQQDIIASILTNVRLKFQECLVSQEVPTKVSSQKTIGELIRDSSAKSQELALSTTPLTPTNEHRMKILAPGSLLQSTPVKRPYELIHTDPMQMNLLSSQLKLAPHEPRRDLKLRSIHELREKVALEKSKVNIITIKESVFVGLFDHSRGLIQNGSKLYAINFKAYLKEQVYQFYLFDFGNFPPIEIVPPGNKLPFMIEMNLKDIEKYEPEIFRSLKFKTAKEIIDALKDYSSMFQDYLTLNFQINDNGIHEIKCIPCIIPDHVPNLAYLGRFFIDLANKVDYSNERDCFHQIGRIIGDFYSEPPVNMNDIEVHRKYHEFVNIRLFEAIKRYLIIPDWLFTKENICQITDTHDLYKVFERC